MARILVVEDEPLIAMMLQDWLAELRFETIGPAATVAGALELLDSHGVDAAILDHTLRNEECDAVADALRKRNIPFALSTGHAEPAVLDRFEDAVMLAKPFDHAAVAQVVDQLMSKIQRPAAASSPAPAANSKGAL